MGGLGMLAMMLGDSPDPPPAGAGGMMSPFGMGMGGMGMGGMGMGGMGMMNPMSMMMGTARDANGKKIDYGDIMKNQMRNGFHMAMTGRALPPGQDGGDFVKNMAPIWAMQRMRMFQPARRRASIPGTDPHAITAHNRQQNLRQSYHGDWLPKLRGKRDAEPPQNPLLSRKKRFFNMMGMNPMMGMGMSPMMGMGSMFGMGMPMRDANGKKIDYGDMMKHSMRNNFHFAMTGRMLPPGQEGGDFVKDMAPIWAMKRMQRMQRLQQAQQHILQNPARDRAAKAASNARYVEYIRRVQSQIPPSLRNQKSQQTVNPTKSVG